MKHSKKGSRGPRLYFSHFQNRILCAFLLCTLIPIFIIGGISYAVSYNIAKDKILNASISADAQLHTQFDNRLQQVENIADCSRSKFLTKLLKTFDKTFREIFPVFISTKRREKPSAFFDNNFVNNAYFSEAASSSSSHLASSSSKAPISSRMTCLCLWSS